MERLYFVVAMVYFLMLYYRASEALFFEIDKDVKEVSDV